MARIPTVEISIDGSPLSIARGTRLDVLLDALWESTGHEPALVAVDAQYVPREGWPAVLLHDGARVETMG